MIYPMNIFTSDPTSSGIRPFIIFLAYEPEFNVGKSQNWRMAMNSYALRGGFVLPFPDTGMVDTQTNEYSQDHPLGSMWANAFDNPMGKGLAMTAGIVPDPMVTQIYKGSQPRTWAGTWQIIPQSAAEAALVFLLIKNLKVYASPDSIPIDKKWGFLSQPYVFDIIFSNPIIELAMNFNKMAISSYSINYFAQGYPSTYKDMMPKHIELSMNFKEFGLKYRHEWELF